jgi:hypothetical protein
MANWIAGYWFAKQFGLKFAHIPFSTKKWDEFLGFGEDEVQVDELIRKGYKTVILPLFDEDNPNEVDLIKKIIKSYSGKKIVFIAEQDQIYRDQFGVIEDLKLKFYNAKARKKDRLIYSNKCFNIAIHVRRTVIIDSKVVLENEKVKAMRWLSNDYYEKVLKQVLVNIKVDKPIKIYIFSTVKAKEFDEFAKYGEVHFCTDMDEYSSFLHLINADMIITSKSSFSYKPALLNKGIKICPRNFWHGYPKQADWILTENDGSFDIKNLNKVL